MSLEQSHPLREIGENLKTAREEACLGIDQAAATVNASPRLLENYEAGDQNISVVRLLELADAYKVSPAWLIRGDAEVDYLMDPDLSRFFGREWGAFDQEEQGFIKEMILNARGLLRRRGGGQRNHARLAGTAAEEAGTPLKSVIGAEKR